MSAALSVAGKLVTPTGAQPMIGLRAQCSRSVCTARPGDAQTIGLQPQLLHDGDIFAPSMQVITCDVAGMAGEDRALFAAEHLPHAQTPTAAGADAFNLVRRGGNAPYEILWKLHTH